MTNFEHIMENPELVKKLVLGKLAVKNGEAHNCIPIDINGENIRGLECKECDLHGITCNECVRNKENWLNAEYKPVPKLTKREKAFLDAVCCPKSYIARDGDGNLYIYEDKPNKSIDAYRCLKYNGYSLIKKSIYGDLFPFITWDDKEPTSVKWLRTLDVEEGVPDE